MQDKAGIRFANTAGRAGIEVARRCEGWKALNYIMGALWATVSFKYC